MTKKCVPICGYEADYSICDDGTVLSIRPRERVRGGPMKQSNKAGYRVLNLQRNNKARLWRVHRLVAEHFIPNPENKKQVNHKDCNRSNNHVTNLEWVTNRENAVHARKNNRFPHPEKYKHAVLSEEKVRLIRELHKTIGYRQIAKRLGVHVSTVVNVLHGTTWAWVV